MKNYCLAIVLLFCFLNIAGSAAAQGVHSHTGLPGYLMQITPGSHWQQTDSVKLRFNAFHTQGMVKAGPYFYISSVEILEATRRYPAKQNGYDRDTGKGRGHVFKIDSTGALVKDIPVGEGDMYHPSGLDFDGKYIWFAVAEYRPDSRSVICRLDIETDAVEVLFQYDDHIGTLIINKDNQTMVAASWGAETFYSWPLTNEGKIGSGKGDKIRNMSWYIAYQDSQYVGGHMMFGSGIRQYKHRNGTGYVLGGWELIDLRTMKPVWQLPVTAVSSGTGNSLVNNPCFVEAAGTGVKAWFAPDDDEKTVIYGFYIRK